MGCFSWFDGLRRYPSSHNDSKDFMTSMILPLPFVTLTTDHLHFSLWLVGPTTPLPEWNRQFSTIFLRCTRMKSEYTSLDTWNFSSSTTDIEMGAAQHRRDDRRRMRRRDSPRRKHSKSVKNYNCQKVIRWNFFIWSFVVIMNKTILVMVSIR